MHERAAPRENLWRVGALLLAVVTLGAGWPLLLRAGAMVQIDYNEGWNAYRDALAAHMGALYSTLPVLQITNYPPVSFYVVGVLGRLSGDVTIAGRMLSLVSLGAIGVAIGAITRQFTGTRYTGACAALLFILWLEIWMPNRIGVNDPQLLGMAFELAGFYVFLRPGGSGRAMEISAGLFTLALFTKQNLVALPLGAGASLLFGREWRRLFRFALAGLLCAAMLFAAIRVTGGPYLLAHVLRGRAYRLADAAAQSGLYILIFLPFFGIAARWVWQNRADARRRPLFLSWLAAHAAGFIFSGGDGTGGNMLFEAMVLDAIIVPIAYTDYFARRPDASPNRAAWLLALPMLFPLCLLPSKIAGSLPEWRSLPLVQEQFAQGAGLLRAAPTPVLCENLLMCYQAGKPSAFDPYFVWDQIRLGRLDECSIVVLVARQQLGMVELGDVDRPEPPARSRSRFTPLFMQALRQRYRILLRTAEFTLWVPQSGPELPQARVIDTKCQGIAGLVTAATR